MKRSPFSLLRLARSIPTRAESTSASSSPPPPPHTSPRVSAIVDELAALTLLELSHLTETLRTQLRVDQMSFVAVMTPGMALSGLSRTTNSSSSGGGTASAAAEKVEKISFDLKLESFDAASKIKIIKEVRSFTDLGLKEAKDLVEKAPAVLKKGVLKEEAEKIVEKMKLAGAKVVME